MRRFVVGCALMLCLCMIAGCAGGGETVGDAREGAFVAHGDLHGGESLAKLDGALYAFLPKGEGGGAREYLYELDEASGKGRIVCGKENCAHEEQGTLADPCRAFSYATAGLMAAEGSLFAGSRNGSMGVTRFDPKGGPPEVVLTCDGEMACFLVRDGAIYYAQQDQAYPMGPLASETGGYRLMKRALEDKDAPAQVIYAREGSIGYIACCQEIGGMLYLTELVAGDGGEEMNIVRVSPEGGVAEIVAPGCGGHYIAQVGGRLGVSRRNGDGTWTALLMDKDGGNAVEVATTQAACQVVGAEGMLLVDSGTSLPARERTLSVYSAEGVRLGTKEIPADCGDLLGADGGCAYYWETRAGGAPRLNKAELAGLLPETA